MFKTVLIALTSFIGTNIDDIFLNTLFFSEAKTKPERRSVVLGVYLGIGALIFISLLAAFALRSLPTRIIALLGFVPIFLSLKEIFLSRKEQAGQDEHSLKKKSASLLFNTALITLANGADNLGVYIPLFASLSKGQIILTVCIFLCLTAVWCLLGKALSSLPVIERVLSKYKKIIVPVLYIALGLYILADNFFG